jgi:UDP-N-acetylglucosamine acyltransferase
VSSNLIHPLAIVHPDAKIGSGTSVGPYSIVGSNVAIGNNCSIASHVVIEGNTSIGDDNQIFQFASLGAAPQDLKFRGELSRLQIGDANTIREYVTLQPGTEGGGMVTKIGSRNLFMVSTHVAHDVNMGDGNIIANSSAIAGHVEIGNNVRMMGLSGIHQFVKIGDHALISAGAMVSQDVPPFCTVQGDRARLVGINTIGLSRASLSEQEVRDIKSLYRALFLHESKETFSQKVHTLRTRFKGSIFESFLNFIESSKRGVCPLRKGSPLEE